MAMRILAASENLSMVDSYNLTRNPETERMSNHVGETLAVERYMVREEERPDTGEVITIVSINDGTTTYSTNSPTFVREFMAILEMAKNAGAAIHHIKVASGTSKRGREYNTCVFID